MTTFSRVKTVLNMPVGQATRLACAQVGQAYGAAKPQLQRAYTTVKPYLPSAAALLAAASGIPLAIGSIVQKKIDVNNVQLQDAEFLVAKITSERGIDNEAFKILSYEAQRFSSEIVVVEQSGREAYLNALLDLMSLNIKLDEKIVIYARGDDARSAIASLTEQISKKLAIGEIVDSTLNREKIVSATQVTDKIVMGTALVVDGILDIDHYPSIDLRLEAEKRAVDVEEILQERTDAVMASFRGLEEDLAADKSEIARGLNEILIQLKTKILHIMAEDKLCASDAIRKLLRQYKGLRDSNDSKFSSIYADMCNLCGKVLAIKHKKSTDIAEEIDKMKQRGIILVAADISPSDIGLLYDRRLRGVVRERGSRKDHFSLRMIDREKAGVVRAKGVMANIRTGDRIIVDGISGKIVINPSPNMLREYRIKMKTYKNILGPLKELRGLAAETRDNVRIELMGNAAGPEEVESILKHGMDGVGLVRTEFFFMNKPGAFHRDTLRDEEPSIKEQVQYYSKIIAAAGGKEVIFRTIDPDGDKKFPFLKQTNGELKIDKKKGLGLCLEVEEYYYIFRNQLKALLQTGGKFKLMFPLVRSKREFIRALGVVAEARAELLAAGETVNDEIEFGVMVEHPDLLKELALLREATAFSFASLGTNDLTHYVTLIDRYDNLTSPYFSEMDSRVLKAIKESIDKMKGGATEKELSCCGDIGNDWRALLLLIGMGLRKISLSTAFVDQARFIIRNVYREDLEMLAENIRRIKTPEEIKRHIEDYTRDKIRSGRWAGLKEIEKILFLETT